MHSAEQAEPLTSPSQVAALMQSRHACEIWLPLVEPLLLKLPDEPTQSSTQLAPELLNELVSSKHSHTLVQAWRNEPPPPLPPPPPIVRMAAHARIRFMQRRYHSGERT